MPRANATVDATVNTTANTAVFQSSRHVTQNGLLSGITVPGDGAPAHAIRFKCTSDSSATLRVHIPGLHNAGEYAHVKAGETDDFVGPGDSQEIHVVYVSAASSTAKYNYSVIA